METIKPNMSKKRDKTTFGDFFPSLDWVDYLTDLILEMKTTFLAVDAFLDEIIVEHESNNKKNDDFLGILLQLQECGRLDFQHVRDNLKTILMVFLFLYPSIYVFIYLIYLYILYTVYYVIVKYIN